MTSYKASGRTEHMPLQAWGKSVTPNERFWLEIIRLASADTDPPPTLERVQRLRAIFQK